MGNFHTPYIRQNEKMTPSKNGKGYEQNFIHQKGVQKANRHEKMLQVIDCQGNANEDNNEIAFHSCENVTH